LLTILFYSDEIFYEEKITVLVDFIYEQRISSLIL